MKGFGVNPETVLGATPGLGPRKPLPEQTATATSPQSGSKSICKSIWGLWLRITPELKPNEGLWLRIKPEFQPQTETFPRRLVCTAGRWIPVSSDTNIGNQIRRFDQTLRASGLGGLRPHVLAGVGDENSKARLWGSRNSKARRWGSRNSKSRLWGSSEIKRSSKIECRSQPAVGWNSLSLIPEPTYQSARS